MDVIAMARELGAALQQSDEYTAYNVAKNAADGDEVLQEMIGEFNLKKLSLSTEVAVIAGSAAPEADALYELGPSTKPLDKIVMKRINESFLNMGKKQSHMFNLYKILLTKV